MDFFGIKLFRTKTEELEQAYRRLDYMLRESQKVFSENEKILIEIRKGSLALDEKASKLEKYRYKIFEAIRETEIESIERIKNKEKQIDKIIAEKNINFPFVAKIISEFEYYRDIKTAEFLETKKHPAINAASDVKRYAKEKRKLIRDNKILLNYISLYEYLFPYIKDFQPEDIDFLLEEKKEDLEVGQEKRDPVFEYVPEYRSLTETERNQRALERYIKAPKSNWKIGIMYERYIGYLYEQEGYDVEYFGANKGFEDLGRDLICKKGNRTVVVQCKYWSHKKKFEIREAHINQLYGTTVKHFIDEFKKLKESYRKSLFPEILYENVNIGAVLTTSTTASKTAKDFADALGVEIREKTPMDYNYPMIKCNLVEGIYHLPIDQQYDKMIMGIKNRKYVKTVKEAEDLGCRRAYRWMGN